MCTGCPLGPPLVCTGCPLGSPLFVPAVLSVPLRTEVDVVLIMFPILFKKGVGYMIRNILILSTLAPDECGNAVQNTPRGRGRGIVRKNVALNSDV